MNKKKSKHFWAENVGFGGKKWEEVLSFKTVIVEKLNK